MHLIDTSAWNRLGHHAARARFEALVEADEAAICTVVRLEILNGAHGQATIADTLDALDGLEHFDVNLVIAERALEVQRLVLARSRGRRPKAGDYLVAATAELHAATVLHHDADFQTIAAVTGQPVERIP